MSLIPDPLRFVIQELFSKEANTKPDVVWASVTELMSVLALLASPYFLKLAIDALNENSISVGVCVALSIGIVISWVASAIFTTIRVAFTDRIINRLTKHIYINVAKNQLPRLATGPEQDSGRLHGTLERLPMSLQLIVEGLLWRVVPTVVQVCIALVVVAFLVPFYYVTILAVVLFGFFAFSHFSAKKYEDQAQVTNQAAGKLSSSIGELFRNSQRIVFNNANFNELAILSSASDNKITIGWERSLLLIKAAFQQYGTLGVGLTVLLGIGAFDVFRGIITIGDFTLLQAYSLQFAAPLGAFGYVVRQAGVALENVNEAKSLMSKNISINSAKSTETSFKGPQTIKVDGLQYERPDGFKLSDIAIEIPKGTFTAIVGPNGAGKSTFAKILAGILPAKAGEIRVGDRKVTHSLNEIEATNVLYVPQKISMFNRTLAENLSFGNSEISEIEAKEMLEDFGFYEDGSDVDLQIGVGENGTALSGGQLQKAELVRLFGVDASVIVMDESMSALDKKSRTKIVDQIVTLMTERSTVAMVTHDLAIAEKADQVVFIMDGVVSGFGSHKELKKTNVNYLKFWQFSNAD